MSDRVTGSDPHKLATLWACHGCPYKSWKRNAGMYSTGTTMDWKLLRRKPNLRKFCVLRTMLFSKTKILDGNFLEGHHVEKYNLGNDFSGQNIPRKRTFQSVAIIVHRKMKFRKIYFRNVNYKTSIKYCTKNYHAWTLKSFVRCYPVG